LTQRNHEGITQSFALISYKEYNTQKGIALNEKECF